MTSEEIREKYGYRIVFSFDDEGLAVVHKSRYEGDLAGEWFHVKRDGTPAYSQRYSLASSFFEGLAYVQIGGGNWIYILPDGTKAFEAEFIHAEGFKDGRAKVAKADVDGLYFYIDRQGNAIE